MSSTEKKILCEEETFQQTNDRKSYSMQTLRESYVNAAFVFLCVLLTVWIVYVIFQREVFLHQENVYVSRCKELEDAGLQPYMLRREKEILTREDRGTNPIRCCPAKVREKREQKENATQLYCDRVNKKYEDSPGNMDISEITLHGICMEKQIFTDLLNKLMIRVQKLQEGSQAVNTFVSKCEFPAYIKGVEEDVAETILDIQLQKGRTPTTEIEPETETEERPETEALTDYGKSNNLGTLSVVDVANNDNEITDAIAHLNPKSSDMEFYCFLDNCKSLSLGVTMGRDQLVRHYQQEHELYLKVGNHVQARVDRPGEWGILLMWENEVFLSRCDFMFNGQIWYTVAVLGSDAKNANFMYEVNFIQKSTGKVIYTSSQKFCIDIIKIHIDDLVGNDSQNTVFYNATIIKHRKHVKNSSK